MRNTTKDYDKKTKKTTKGYDDKRSNRLFA